MSEKILLMSGLVFFGFVLSSFCFFPSSSFFVFFCVILKRHSSGSNRTPPHALVLLFLVLFVLSRRILLFRPFWPCVLLLGVFFGVPFWAPRVFGILLELMGLELARPF